MNDEMQFGLDDWFAVFRAGTHTDAGGKTATFTDADLDGIVEQYNAANPAPCVITHDELYSPFAYAQVAEVKREDGVLKARCAPDSIEPQFAELVRAGRLYNRSVQLLPRADGGWKLGHVAFLGAEPPAVEGMPPIQFSAAGRVFSAQQAWDKVDAARRWANAIRILKVIADKVFGPDADDNPVSDWQVSDADEAVGAAREAAKSKTATEGNTMNATNYSQAQLDAATKAAADQARADATAAADKAHAAERAEFQAAKRAGRKAAIEARINALSEAGKLLPHQAPGLAEFALGLGAESFQFSAPAAAGEQPKVETAEPQEYLFTLLESMPKQIAFGKEVGAEDVAAVESVSAEASVADIRAAAHKFQKAQADQGITITYAQAVKQVTAGVET